MPASPDIGRHVAQIGQARYPAGVRSLAWWDAGPEESALDGFRADCIMAAAAGARPEQALLRAWSRPQAALSAGRYHRLPPFPTAAGFQRRLSGGRIVPVGPGVMGFTLAVSSSAWLGQGQAPLRPDQILNRALRPLLTVLRGLGVDAFYGGRDLVTADGRPLAYASFCPMADDVLIVEQLLAVTAPFDALEALCARFDPTGIAGVDLFAFAEATSLAHLGRRSRIGREAGVPDRHDLSERVAAAAKEAFGCAVSEHGAPADVRSAVLADERVYGAFASERGPLPPQRVTAASMTMLGVLEASAELRAGRVHDLEITGDVIAPFAVLDDVCRRCEGLPAGSPAVGAAVLGALTRPGAFVLGVLDLGELVRRLA